MQTKAYKNNIHLEFSTLRISILHRSRLLGRRCLNIWRWKMLSISLTNTLSVTITTRNILTVCLLLSILSVTTISIRRSVLWDLRKLNTSRCHLQKYVKVVRFEVLGEKIVLHSVRWKRN